jgi:hypothetical protein
VKPVCAAQTGDFAPGHKLAKHVRNARLGIPPSYIEDPLSEYRAVYQTIAPQRFADTWTLACEAKKIELRYPDDRRLRDGFKRVVGASEQQMLNIE